MRRSSRFVGILTSFIMVLSLTSPALADDTDGMSAEQVAGLRQQLPTPFFVDSHSENSGFGIVFGGGTFGQFGAQSSSIRTFPDPKGSKLCLGYTDYSCFASSPEGFADANISIPPCQFDSSTACIEGLGIRIANQNLLGSLVRVVDNSLSSDFKSQAETDYANCCNGSMAWGPDTWAGLPQKNLPTPTPPSIWQVPGAIHKGESDTYLTSVSLSARVYKSGQIEFTGFQSEVVPFSEITGSSFHPPAWVQKVSPTENIHQPIIAHRPLTGGVVDPFKANVITCAYEETGKCGLAYRFADGTSAELTLRIPRSLGGWFYGRIANADLSLEPINGKLNRVRIAGSPVSVPIASARFQVFKSGNERYRDHLLQGNFESDFAKRLRQREANGETGIEWTNWDPERGIKDFRAYEPLMEDRAKGLVQMWSINTLPSWQTDNPCFADKTRVQGILTTNAMVYQAGLPTFSKGQLSYQVAGLHNNYDGSEFTGEYTLQMRADDARCLYGYTEAPIQTKVSVTDSGGNQKIATTSVSERGGWLTIRARNFTFSSPKIVVSIKQGKKSKAASTASVSVGKGKSLAAKTLMTKAKIKAKKGDKLDVSVVGAKTSGVTDSGKTLKFKSKGTFYVKVVVTRKNSSATSRVFKVVVK